MIKVLHIIEGVTSGGGTRVVIAMAKNSSRLGGIQHRVVSLSPASSEGIALAKGSGIPVIDAPSDASLGREIEEADIVQVNYWNCPKLNALLRSDLPLMRLLIWFHIAGDTPPQVITRTLIDFADVALASSPYSLTLPVFKNISADGTCCRVGMVYGPADFDRLLGIAHMPHETFNVGYIGTIDFVKMHPNYIAMNAALTIPNLRIIVCGKGGINDDIEHLLRRQARSLDKTDLFDFRGYVEDIQSVISVLDVYGYPLCEGTYACSEANLQEVMFAGVPSVVFPYGGVKHLVIGGETGLVVTSEREYSQAIEHLYHHPDEIKRLGRNAREYARTVFGGENAAAKMNPFYESMMLLPKQGRRWGSGTTWKSYKDAPVEHYAPGSPSDRWAAEMFTEALGPYGRAYLTSMYSQDVDEMLEAEEAISSSGFSALMRSVGYGSVFHYRNWYPEDSYLRLWAGLLLRQQHRHAEAVLEFTAAIRLGFEHWRVHWYLAVAAEAANELELAAEMTQSVIRSAPNFARAHQLLRRILERKERK